LTPSRKPSGHTSSGGARATKLAGAAAETGIQSFAKTKEAAMEFASGYGGSGGGVQVLYKTKGGNKLIDIEATLDKGSDFLQKPNLRQSGGVSDLSGQELRKFLQKEQELLSAGAVEIEQVFIRFWY
jgi:hypothetical protein